MSESIKLDSSRYWDSSSCVYGTSTVENKLTPVILWTNSSPSSNMSAQTINLSESITNFTWLYTIYRYSSDSGDPERQGKMILVSDLASGRNKVTLEEHYMTAANSGGRQLTFNGDNTVAVGAGYWNGSTNNRYGILLTIWGVR